MSLARDLCCKQIKMSGHDFFFLSLHLIRFTLVIKVYTDYTVTLSKERKADFLKIYLRRLIYSIT